MTAGSWTGLPFSVATTFHGAPIRTHSRVKSVARQGAERQTRCVRNLLAQFAAVARNRNLRRLEAAYAASITSEWAFTVALGVFAYQHGGASAVGILGLVRMLPAALTTPRTRNIPSNHSHRLMLRLPTTGH